MLYRMLLLVLIVVFTANGVLAQEATPEATPEPATQDCGECHLDVLHAWQSGAHAQTFQNLLTAWETHGEEDTCLACHTTGFSARTGVYTHESVTCAACHGSTPQNHPPEAITTIPDVEVCADCHATTFTEWENSMHGEQLVCTDCHNPHPQGLRAENANALCISCHTEPEETFAHVTHSETACVDCHWFHNPDESQHVMTGALYATGHDSFVEVRTCIECHSEQDPNWQTVNVSLQGTANPAPVLDAPTTQRGMGFILGAGIGTLLVIAVYSLRRTTR